MHIHIHDSLTLAEIKKVFSNFYPYLKLEFFSTPHQPFGSSVQKNELATLLAIAAVKQTHTDGIIDIQPLQTVNKLEQEFQQRFGLPVQVYYQSKGGWIQTTGLDTLTLKELNEISRNDSDSYIVEEEASEDDTT